MSDINLTIEKGQKIAIVGATGSGKSTLAQLLVGLIDDYRGELLIDGVNMPDYSLSSLRDVIVYTTQDIHLFRDTIKNNIDLKRRLDDEEVFDIVKKTHLLDLVNSLPHGINSIVGGDDGLSLSGGEMQRIAIARSFAANSQIMVFDEVTASLDPEVEKKIIYELEVFADNKTVISISHRLEAIERVDKIVVLKNGSVVETGTHEELLKQSGEYFSLFNICGRA